MFLGIVEMTFGLVNASFSLPEWHTVKMNFFAPWSLDVTFGYSTQTSCLNNWVHCYFLVWPVHVSLRTADVSPRSSPLRDVSRGGTSATQRQKFHNDDVIQSLQNKTGSHGVPNANLFNFTFLLVDFGKVLCSSANELQQNSTATSREEYIPQILTGLLEIHHVYTWPLLPFVFCLSFRNNS